MEGKSADELLKLVEESDGDKFSEGSSSSWVRKVFVVVVVCLVLALLGVGVYSVLPKDQRVRVSHRLASSGEDAGVSGVQASPVALPVWARKYYGDLSAEDVKAMVKDQENNFIGWTLQAFPSEADGFTSDRGKEFDKDGLPNEFFVPLTREEMVRELAVQLNRIVNPIFGGWTDFQEPSVTPLGKQYAVVYEGLASADYLSRIVSGGAVSPVFVDEGQDLYGGKFQLSSGRKASAKFVGVIRQGSVVFEGDSRFRVDVDVDYMRSASEVFRSRHLGLVFERVDDRFVLVGGDVSDKE